MIAPARTASYGASDLPREGVTGTALSAEDREAARIRVLLYALRPDCADPLRPPPAPLTAVAATRIRDPMAGWGDTPRSLEHAPPHEDPTAERAVDVLARLNELPEDARAVLRWLRAHAVYVTPRGLYVDVGLAFAGHDQATLWERDLTARRDGAHHHGRTLVLAAAAEFGLPIA